MTKKSTNPPPGPAATQHLRPPVPHSTLNWSLAQFTLPRIYPILDTATLDRLNFPAIAAAEAMLEGGARILQLRHKTFWSRETFALAETINALCISAGIPFVVNDRADYAAALGAALHIGQDDLTPTDARRVIGAQAILGHSTHNQDQLRLAEQNAEAIDYLAFGPMFTTVSKERPDPTVGIAGLQAIRALTRKPLVAIGGITRDNALTCWNAGADSVAVIADLYPNPCTKTTLRDRMTEWQKLTAA
jgi:thiamine-phosphate pyrophosphorylase